MYVNTSLVTVEYNYQETHVDTGLVFIYANQEVLR